MTAASPTADSLGAPFRVGAALSRSFQVFGAGFIKFVVLSALALLPELIINLVAQTPGHNVAALNSLSTVVRLILSSLANAVCLYGAYQIMRGQSFSVGQSLAVGGRRVGPVVGVAFLSGILTVLATLALVVPGLMLACAFYVAIPACVIEGIGPFASLTRSRQLTKGSRWGIFGLWLLVVLGAMIVGGGLAVVGEIIGGARAATIFTFVVEAVMQALGAVIAAVVYHDLRVAKEGVDVDQLASVFD